MLQKTAVSEQEMFKQSVESSIKVAFAGNNVSVPTKYAWTPGEKTTTSMLIFDMTLKHNGNVEFSVPAYKANTPHTNTPYEMHKFIAQHINKYLEDKRETVRVSLSDISHETKDGQVKFKVLIPYDVFHK